jgi:GNAT superfamily N-acetyltransferase
MKILPFRELEAKNELLPLLDHAFRWTFNPRTFEQFVRKDPRLRNGPIGFCALEDDSVVGFVGALDLTTRTLDGTIDRVCGIYGVSTLPSQVRKGVSTALMNATHQYFRERGYRFSFLFTSHTIVAHEFYRKLGYTDALQLPSAYKVLEPKKTKPARKEKNTELDFDKLSKIYNEYMKDKAGFVLRDRAYFEMLKKIEGLTASQSIMGNGGYVLFKKEKNGIWIREFIALNAKEMDKLIGLAETKAKDLVYDRGVLDDSLLEAYKAHGYLVHEKSHSVLMAKPLTADASFKQAYGNKIHLTSLDFF